MLWWSAFESFAMTTWACCLRWRLSVLGKQTKTYGIQLIFLIFFVAYRSSVFFSLQNLKVHFSFGFLGSIFNNNVNELAIRLVILLVFRCSVYFHYIFTDDTILILITTFNLTFFYVYMEASLFSDWITLNTNLKEVCTEMWKIKTHSVKWTAITL